MSQSETCPRGRADCRPLQNVIADEFAPSGDPASFVCCGYNKPDTRQVTGDRFTLCWKNEAVDERGHWDRRDILDTLSVLSTALSIDENIRVFEGMTDEEMNASDLTSE